MGLDLNDDFKDQCGLFGVFGHPEAANLTYLGLYALQHRGQESAGIVVSDGREMKSHVRLGLVAEIFKQGDIDKLVGSNSIGHVRYSTKGSSTQKNAQPLMVESRRGLVSIAHNGNLTHARELRRKLEDSGAIFQSTTDTEAILHLMARSKKEDLEGALLEALKSVQGAFSLLVMDRERVIALRDPNGFRPLSVGKLDNAFIFASETCAFDIIGATFLRSLEPGEMAVVDANGLRFSRPFPQARAAQCIFEYIYFARPDSSIYGAEVYPIRKEFGRVLAREHPVKADIVVPVPDSANLMAAGFSEESGIPLEPLGMVRNHYVGRTFIEPDQRIRDFGAKVKFNPARGAVAGKRLVVVDDSIVRGTNSRKIVKMFRQAGAKEIHMRISSPPIIDPCHYGIDTPDKEQLIAANHSVAEIRDYLGVDSLEYLSVEGMLSAVKSQADKFCTACFTGEYPVSVSSQVAKLDLERPAPVHG